MKQEIRWMQRLENFKRAFRQLEDAVFLFQGRELSDLEKQGLIQYFEYTFELAWNLIRDYFIYQGITDIKGSRDAFRTALKYGLIEDGDVWMDMIGARNLTSHTYDKEMADEIVDIIVKKFYKEFKALLERFEELAKSHEE